MSNPAQGAVGAETMTAGQAAYEERESSISPVADWRHLSEQAQEKWERIASAAIKHAALASPRADSGERAAGAGISLAALQAAHVARQAEWCPDQLPDPSPPTNRIKPCAHRFRRAAP